jgi:hypothetical protein
MKLGLRKIFGIFLIALIHLTGLLPLLFGHPEMGRRQNVAEADKP